MSLTIDVDNHRPIKDKLEYFRVIGKIPNILLYGKAGVGKKTILQNFLIDIYGNVNSVRNNVMYINCAHGKGIKFIREDLKFFARTNVISHNFKSIVLLNAEQLTIDAQSALRRCIELFSNNTRFFIIVENKYRILKPILSRFCDIYVPPPDSVVGSFYQRRMANMPLFAGDDQRTIVQIGSIIRRLFSGIKDDVLSGIMRISRECHENGVCALDVMRWLNSQKHPRQYGLDEEKVADLTIYFNKVRSEYRNEELLLYKTFYNIFVKMRD